MSVKTLGLKSIMSAAFKAHSNKSKPAKKPMNGQTVNIHLHEIDGKPALLDGNHRVTAMLELGMTVIGLCDNGKRYEMLLSDSEVIGTASIEDGAMKINLDAPKPRFVYREIIEHDNV